MTTMPRQMVEYISLLFISFIVHGHEETACVFLRRLHDHPPQVNQIKSDEVRYFQLLSCTSNPSAREQQLLITDMSIKSLFSFQCNRECVRAIFLLWGAVEDIQGLISVKLFVCMNVRSPGNK